MNQAAGSNRAPRAASDPATPAATADTITAAYGQGRRQRARRSAHRPGRASAVARRSSQNSITAAQVRA